MPAKGELACHPSAAGRILSSCNPECVCRFVDGDNTVLSQRFAGRTFDWLRPSFGRDGIGCRRWLCHPGDDVADHQLPRLLAHDL